MHLFKPTLLWLLLTAFCPLSLAQQESTEDTDKYLALTVDAPFIEMHTGAGRGYPIFYIVERNETIQVLRQRTDWFQVRNAKGLKGWVYIDQMARTKHQNGEPFEVNKGDFESFVARRWEGGVLLGDFGGTSAIGAYGGYHFTRNLALELAFTETLGDVSNGRAADISLLHQPFPDWRYSPFVAIGGGVRETTPKSSLVATEDRVDDSLHVGAGVNIYLTRRFMLRVQYKHYTMLTNRDDDEEVEEWKIGLSTFF